MKIRFQYIVLIALAVANSVNSLFLHHGKSSSASSNSTSDNQQLHALLGTILSVKIGLLTVLRDGLTRKGQSGSSSSSSSGSSSSGLAGLLGGGSGGFNPLSLLGIGSLGGSSSSSAKADDTNFDDFEEDLEEGDSVFTTDES